MKIQIVLTLIAVSAASAFATTPSTPLMQSPASYLSEVRITGVSERNRPGIMIDRTQWVKVGEALPSRPDLTLVAVESSSAIPGARQWKATFATASGEQHTQLFPNLTLPSPVAR